MCCFLGVLLLFHCSSFFISLFLAQGPCFQCGEDIYSNHYTAYLFCVIHACGFSGTYFGFLFLLSYFGNK
ncbi:hypothetical protein GLYMA_19G090751v4 [Glycine max]|nr:hypothetical protein GLYMA_19G090751v4 [Glycine max]KAH1077017.1 hypothetical protein GYH30_052495 [Glycine max]